MPVQDNEQLKKTDESFFQNDEEKRRQEIQNSQDNSSEKSHKLIPILNAKAEIHISRIDNINEKIATHEDKIARNEAKIEKLSAKADRMEDINKMLKNALGSNSVVKKLIESNEQKIEKIRNERIPDRYEKINKHKQKIKQLNNKRDIIEHKLNRASALSDVIKSFSVKFTKERREIFSDAMDRLNAANTECLIDKLNVLQEQKAKLSKEYSSPENSAVDKYNMQKKLEIMNGKISILGDKINKLTRSENHFAEQPDNAKDNIIKAVSDKIKEISDNDEIGITDISENIIRTAESVESDRNITAEKSNPLKDTEEILEDNYNSIDGIINNSSKAELEAAKKKGLSADDISTRNYYKSLDLDNKSVHVEREDIALKILEQLDRQNISFLDIELKNGDIAIITEKDDINAYKNISENIKNERAKQMINPEFFKALPKEFRTTYVMNEQQAQSKIAELKNKGIAHSAVLNGDKSAVTVSKKDSRKAFFTRDQLKKEAQRISGMGKSNDKQKTQNKNQGIE